MTVVIFELTDYMVDNIVSQYGLWIYIGGTFRLFWHNEPI